MAPRLRQKYWKKTKARVQALAERGSGLAVAIVGGDPASHNHAWEFEKIDGRIKHEIFAEREARFGKCK